MSFVYKRVIEIDQCMNRKIAVETVEYLGQQLVHTYIQKLNK